MTRHFIKYVSAPNPNNQVGRSGLPDAIRIGGDGYSMAAYKVRQEMKNMFLPATKIDMQKVT